MNNVVLLFGNIWTVEGSPSRSSKHANHVILNANKYFENNLFKIHIAFFFSVVKYAAALLIPVDAGI